MVDAADARFPPRDEGREHESRRRAEVRRRDGRALEWRRPANDRRAPLDAHVGAEADELDGVQEAILEDRLDEARRAPGLRHEREKLRLKVRRETGVRRRLDVDGREGTPAEDAHRTRRDLDTGSRPRERVEERA